jgi:murein DD-endopeptidase MepM/ murein hydrolase activator NlpD
VRRLAIVTLAACALGGIGVADASLAQSPEDTIRTAREEREAVRAERAARARDLVPLEAEEEELLAALQALDEHITAQEVRVREAELAVAAARDEASRLRDEIARTELRAAEIRTTGKQRAAQAFVHTDRDAIGALLSSRDPNEALLRRTLLEFVTLADIDVTDELRRVEDDLTRLRTEAQRQEALARERQAELTAILDSLERDRAAQEEIRARLADRIALIEAELDEMDAQDAQLSELIKEKQAEIAAREAAAREASLRSPSPGAAPSAYGMIWPTDGHLSSGFGYRRHPILGYSRLHAGLDIGNGYGTPIWSAAAGTVIYSGWRGGYGNAVVVDHGGGVSTLYGHLNERLVAEGTTIDRGEWVGLMGSTGLSTGPHLHFEVRVGGSARDPLVYLP